MDPLIDKRSGQLSRITLMGVPLLVVAYGIKAYFKKGDLPEFIRAAENLISGAAIYLNEPRAFTYPPFFAFIMIPFTWLEINGAKIAWYILSIMFVILSLRAAGKITAPALGSLARCSGTRLSSRVVLSLAVLLTLRFILSTFDNQQSDLMLLAFSLIGLAALMEGKQLLCGVFLAVAVSIKLTPLLFIPYLLFKRAYLGLLCLVVSSVVIWSIPELLFPADSGTPLISSWYEIVITKVSPWEGGTPWTEGGGIWTATSILNQSLPPTIYRYFVAAPIQIHGGQIQVNIFDMDPGTVKTLSYILCFALLTISGFVMWKFRKNVEGTAIDFGIVFCLMLLLSPQSSKPHFSTLLLPHMSLLVILAKQKNRALLSLLVCSVILNTVSAEGFVGRRFSDVLEAHGAITGGTLLIWLSLLLLKVKGTFSDTSTDNQH